MFIVSEITRSKYICLAAFRVRLIYTLCSNFDGSEDDEVNTIIKKKYELCAAAANHITSIGTYGYAWYYSLVELLV